MNNKDYEILQGLLTKTINYILPLRKIYYEKLYKLLKRYIFTVIFIYFGSIFLNMFIKI